jgi:outer membrane protein TolC
MMNCGQRGQMKEHRNQDMQMQALRNGLFDEPKRMPHSSFTMKWLGFFLLVVLSAFSGMAQETNTSTTGANLTNAPDLVYEEMTNSSTVDTNLPINKRELSLQDCIELTLKHNLDLQIDRYSPALSLYTLRGAYSGYDPSFSMSAKHGQNTGSAPFINTNSIIPRTNAFGSFISEANTFDSQLTGLLPWGTTYTLEGNTIQTGPDSSGSAGNVSFASAKLDQPLLKNFWIDSTRLAIRVDKNRLKFSQLQLKLNIMQTVTALEQAYYDLIFNRENVLVQKSAAQQTDRLVAESKKKLEVGALAPLDLALAQAQAAQNRAAVISAQSQLETQERKVKGFIAAEFTPLADVDLQPSGTLTAPFIVFNRQDSWAKALAQRPEYLQAKLDVEKTGIQLKFDWNQLFPQLDVIGTFGYNGDGGVYSQAFYDIQRMNRSFYSVGGQLTVPLANTSARNTYKSDKVTLQQLVLTVKRQERDILIQVDNDIGTLRADYNAVQATHAQRLYEEQALDAEEKKLANGKSTTYNVILVQRDLTTARGAEIQALDTYNKDLAQLSLDEGSTLERLNIEFNVK